MSATAHLLVLLAKRVQAWLFEILVNLNVMGVVKGNHGNSRQKLL